MGDVSVLASEHRKATMRTQLPAPAAARPGKRLSVVLGSVRSRLALFFVRGQLGPSRELEARDFAPSRRSLGR
jgi:hypothetical protein